METTTGGRALETFIKRRIATSEQIHSILELSRVTGIRANTMYEWFSGARVPRTDSLTRVGAALGVPASRLLDAYEGRSPIEVNDAALAAIEQAVEHGVEAAVQRLIEGGMLGRAADRR